MLSRLYNPMLALHPTPPPAVSQVLGTVWGAGSAQFGASLSVHCCLGLCSTDPSQGTAPAGRDALGLEFLLGSPSLLPARGFAHSSDCRTFLWCPRGGGDSPDSRLGTAVAVPEGHCFGPLGREEF